MFVAGLISECAVSVLSPLPCLEALHSQPEEGNVRNGDSDSHYPSVVHNGFHCRPEGINLPYAEVHMQAFSGVLLQQVPQECALVEPMLQFCTSMHL